MGMRMKTAKQIGLVILLVAAVFTLSACAKEGNKDLVVLTGGEQGTYYPLGGALSQIINEHVEGLTATAVVSGASVVNVNDVNDGKGDLAFIQNDIAYYAAEGTQMFEGKVDKFKAVAALYPEVIQIVAAADSGIANVEDLRGKRVAVGDQGSGAEANARQILEAHGLTYDDIKAEYMAFSDAAGNIQDGNIDAAFITAGTPTAAIEALKVSRPITLVSITPDKVSELTEKYPYYTSFTIPKDVYGTETDATTVTVQSMLIASDELSEEQVYRITKGMFEHLDTFASTHQAGQHITRETALEGISVELHPGAQKYYDETK
ncbi:TAXI family TRAP transporter solute-binding subunit [Paenibacillus sambharensis]|nr:TAXI family TRAP transporter solute-binding subunit [Paenibacillus sambharensis]